MQDFQMKKWLSGRKVTTAMDIHWVLNLKLKSLSQREKPTDVATISDRLRRLLARFNIKTIHNIPTKQKPHFS
jgi:hypothetical protein